MPRTLANTSLPVPSRPTNRLHPTSHLVERLDDGVAGEACVLHANLLGEDLRPRLHHPLRQHLLHQRRLHAQQRRQILQSLDGSTLVGKEDGRQAGRQAGRDEGTPSRHSTAQHSTAQHSGASKDPGETEELNTRWATSAPTSFAEAYAIAPAEHPCCGLGRQEGPPRKRSRHPLHSHNTTPVTVDLTAPMWLIYWLVYENSTLRAHDNVCCWHSHAFVFTRLTAASWTAATSPCASSLASNAMLDMCSTAASAFHTYRSTAVCTDKR